MKYLVWDRRHQINISTFHIINIYMYAWTYIYLHFKTGGCEQNARWTTVYARNNEIINYMYNSR